MLVDALTVAALVDELGELVGARVQGVVQPDSRSVALELFIGTRRYLTLSADPADEGVRLSVERARRGVAPPTPLCLALRAHGTGARLVAVHQPPHERILSLELVAERRLTVVAELTGRLANLVLVAGDGTILALAHPVTRHMTRARELLPGRPYVPPPVPDKHPPEAVTADTLAGRLAAAPERPAWRVLVEAVRAVSPLVAHELVHRAAGNAEATAADVDPGALHLALVELFAVAATRRWTPCVARSGGRVVAYAPYWLGHRGEVEPMPSISAAMTAYEADRGRFEPYHEARSAVAALIDEARWRVERRIASLAREGADPHAIAAAKRAGELILTFAHHIRPGQTELVAGFDPATPERVPLDPAKTPAENAARYFDRYRRLRRAAEALPTRLAEAEAQRATLLQLATDLALATDRAGIDAVYDALAEGGYLDRPLPKRGAPTGAPLVWTSPDGFRVLVGRNSRQNEVVTFRQAARGDLWLHARDVPGAHVVIKTAGRPVPERTLYQAAALAAWFSRARNEATVPVAVTDVRHVRRLAGGGPGMVTLARSETIVVRPAAPAPTASGDVSQP